jgi:hypothetical protein
MNGLEKSKAITEIIKSIAEIIALIVAGLWAYSHFQETEKPSLESRVHSESVISWFQLPSPNHCLGSFGVSFKNIGKKAIDFNNATLRVWIMKQPPSGKIITYLDPAYFLSEKPIYERSFGIDIDKVGVLGHFPPDTEAQTDFTFSFEKKHRKSLFFLLSRTVRT